MTEDKNKKIKVADIVLPADKKGKEEFFKSRLPLRSAPMPSVAPIEEKLKEIREKKPERIKGERIEEAGGRFFKESSGGIRAKLKKYFIYLLILIFIGGLVYAAIEILPRAEIKISLKKTEWKFSDWLTASKGAVLPDSTAKQIPAEILFDKKNLVLDFPATGKKYVEKKAGGEITIYNAYSSKAQTLIDQTRFEAPDGKIFFLEKRVVVPGVKVEENKIIPSSVKAKVIAEKAGGEYNIGPVEKFVLPGFKGSPKYEGFYATSKEAMKGGFTGEMIYPTENDISLAKGKIRTNLEESLFAFLFSQMPQGLKVIDGARKFDILKETIGEEVDQKGNFSAFLEGRLTIIAFKEDDILKMVNGLAKENLGDDFEPKNYTLDYGASRFDIENGKMAFQVDYSGIFWKPIDIEDFKKSVLGRKEEELKISIFSLPGVERATVSFWPFWVKKTPDKAEKIKVGVE